AVGSLRSPAPSPQPRWGAEGEERARRRVDEVEHVVVQDTGTLERRAEPALEQRPRRRADDDRRERSPGNDPKCGGERSKSDRAEYAGDRPFERHRAGRTGRNGTQRRDRGRVSPDRLAELARGRVAA